MGGLRAVVRVMNRWHSKEYRELVVNGQKGYMSAFYRRLRQARIEYKPSWTGRGLDRRCTLYVKEADIERARIVCRGLPRDWYSKLMASERSE